VATNLLVVFLIPLLYLAITPLAGAGLVFVGLRVTGNDPRFRQCWSAYVIAASCALMVAVLWGLVVGWQRDQAAAELVLTAAVCGIQFLIVWVRILPRSFRGVLALASAVVLTNLILFNIPSLLFG
jgi:hypothetical protein